MAMKWQRILQRITAPEIRCRFLFYPLLSKIHRGKRILKQLAGQNTGFVNIEITDKNNKAFTAVAKEKWNSKVRHRHPNWATVSFVWLLFVQVLLIHEDAGCCAANQTQDRNNQQ